MVNNIENNTLSNLFPRIPHCEMIFVKGGSFMIREKHKVTLSDFYIGKFPVTNALWKAVSHDSSINPQSDNQPVGMVSWDDIHNKFLCELNEKLDNQDFVFRLPSETEWEYSACDGVHCKNKFDDTISFNIDKFAEYRKNNPYEPKAVELEEPNGLYIHGMFGDIWEWCEDDWQDHFKVPVDGKAWKEPNPPCQYRVVRGHKYYARNYCSPNLRNKELGFRLVYSVNTKSS